MAVANIKWVGVRENKFKPEVTEVAIGFEVDGGEDLHFLSLPVAGGSEKQQKFASAVLATLLKQGGPYAVDLEVNERGYTDVVVPRQEGV